MDFKYDIKFADNTPQLHEALDSWAEQEEEGTRMKHKNKALPPGRA